MVTIIILVIIAFSRSKNSRKGRRQNRKRRGRRIKTISSSISSSSSSGKLICNRNSRSIIYIGSSKSNTYKCQQQQTTTTNNKCDTIVDYTGHLIMTLASVLIPGTESNPHGTLVMFSYVKPQ